MDHQARLESIQNLSGRLSELHRGRKWNDPQERVIKAIFQDGYKRIFIRKGRKGGGTETIMYPCVRIAGCFDHSACYIIGPQDALQREIVWKSGRLQRFCPPEWNVRFGEYEARAKFPNKSFIKITGANDHKSLVGIEGDVFVFDELADHDTRAYENCYPNIASRDAIWIVVGAPPLNRIKSSFYYKLEQQIKKDPDWFFIHWTTWDNADFLPGGLQWIQNEKAKYYAMGKGLDWEQRYEARYVIGGAGTVLSNFNPDLHVVPADVLEARISKDKHKLRWFQIFDPGYATCFCVLFGCYNPYASEVYLLDEIYETDRNRLSVNEIWPRVQAKAEQLYPGGNWRRVYDSAAPGFPNEVRSRWGRGFTFAPTYKEKGDEDTWFRVINAAFYTNRCFVSEACEHGSEEMQDYSTDDSGNYPDKDNHFLDDLRYFFKAINYKPVEKQDDIIIKPSPVIKTIEEEIRDNGDSVNPWAGMFEGHDFEDGWIQ